MGEGGGHRVSAAPSVRRYAWHRVRRIMPAYVVTVLVAYLLYHFRDGGAEPRTHVDGVAPQPDADADLHRQLPTTAFVSAPRTYADVEPGRRGRVLRRAAAVGLPAVGGVVPTAWRPGLLLSGLAALALITPGVAGPGAHHRLPARRCAAVAADVSAWFIGGMVLAVLQVMGVRCVRVGGVPLAVVCYFIVSTPIAGAPTTSPADLREALFKAVFYAVIATLPSRRWRSAIAAGTTRNCSPAGRWCSSARSPTRSS